MKNGTYYIKPMVLKYGSFDRQKHLFEEVKSDKVIAIVTLLIIVLIVTYVVPIAGAIIFAIVIFSLLYYYSIVSGVVNDKQRYKENLVDIDNKRLSEEADKMTLLLINILDKSDILVKQGLPAQLNSIKSTLDTIKFEFKENALIPFWDEVENFVKKMNSYEESLTILERNKQTYYKVVHSTENNFPNEFPIRVDIQFPEQTLSDFKFIQREVFKKFEFANLWEQRKTQKIMAFGFSNLKAAIDNMSNSIVSTITALNDNMQSGFETLSADIRALEFNNYQDMTTTNALIEKNLSSIDNKLYYIQYNRKPIEPFGDIFAQKR